MNRLRRFWRWYRFLRQRFPRWESWRRRDPLVLCAWANSAGSWEPQDYPEPLELPRG